MEKRNNFKFDLWDFLTFVSNKRSLLFVVLITSFIVFSIISYLIPSKYESSVILFPSSSSSISEALLSKNYSSKDIMKFGTEEEVEQFLQILKSDEIQNYVVKKFDLKNHYNISTNEEFPKTEIKQTFSKNVEIKKTEFNSIKISVLDIDPIMAKDIADYIAFLGDSLLNKVIQVRAIKAFKMVEREYYSVQKNLNLLHDSLNTLRSLGVYEYETQAEVFNQALAEALVKNNSNGIKEIEKKLEILAQYGGAYSALRNQIIYETERMGLLQSKYMEAKIDAEQNLPHIFIISKAEIPEKKSYPIRWLIVLVSVSITMLFASLVLVFLEKKKKY